MDQYEQIKKLFKSGRYECDNYFYTQIKEIVQDLSLYECLPPIIHNKQTVEKVEALTKQHLRLLENDDDEQAALKVIHLINNSIKKIDPIPIAPIMQKIQAMNSLGYEKRVIMLIKSQSCKRLYLEVCDRIMNSVRDPIVRLNQLLIVGMFFSKNTTKLLNFIEIFGNVLENGVKQFKIFRERRQFIEKHSEIQQHEKVQNFIKGTPVLYKKVLRFNEIYRILSGDSKYGLKINSFKREIQQFSKDNQKYTAINCEHFKNLLLRNEPLNDVCSLCLEHSEFDHKQCLGAIKVLYHRNS